MIAVKCVVCGESFQVEDDQAGGSEICPACGALNDVPRGESDSITALAVHPLTVHSPPTERALVFWWRAAAVALVAAFAVGIFFLLPPDWEQQHVQSLSDAVNRADGMMSSGDYSSAAQQYQFVLDTVGNRQLQSAFLRALVDHSRAGETDAKARIAQLAVAATIPSATTNPTAAAQDPNVAIAQLQKAAENFQQFVSQHPFVYQDEQGAWRKRRFVVADMQSNADLKADPPRFDLQYECDSRVSGPFNDKADADACTDMSNLERETAVHCSSTFELRDGVWQVADRSNDLAPIDLIRNGLVVHGVDPALPEMRELEDEAFLGK